MALYVEGLHRIQDGHLVRAGSVVPPVRSDTETGTLWVGQGSVVQGAIWHEGAVVLGRGAMTWQGIRGGHEVVIGAHAQVKGPVEAVGRIVVQSGAVVNGDLRAGTDVFLLGECSVGSVEAAGDIVIVGAPKTGALRPAGRVQTRPW